MERRQFLRRSALFSLAATALPGLASAFAGPEAEDTTNRYQNRNIRLRDGRFVSAWATFCSCKFKAAESKGSFDCELYVSENGMETAPKGLYTLQRQGEPATAGEQVLATFRLNSHTGTDVLRGQLPASVIMRLTPGQELQVELEKGILSTLAARAPEADDCFLTTACTAARGLADDCPELTSIRGLRDGHMRGSQTGSSLVQEYYRIAPGIVRQVNARPNHAAIWSLVYADLVLPAVALIEAGQKAEAVAHYTTYVQWMQEAFAPVTR